MKRPFMSSICGALLVWAAFDDVLAVQTPDPDDDIAAAMDNDCLRDAKVNVQAVAETERIMCSCPPSSATTAIRLGPVEGGTAVSRSEPCRLLDPLYLFMSLQC